MTFDLTLPWQVFRGEALITLRTIPDASFDAVVTDPPYGLSTPPDVGEVLRHWLIPGRRYAHKGAGFMGREWDSFVPSPELWREVLRTLKPGGHLLAFAGTRTLDLMGISLRLAGFEVRDCLMWLYGQGFPKSLDVSRALDEAAGAKREVVGPNPTWREAKRDNRIMQPVRGGGAQVITTPATPLGERWEGYGTALKPAWEPILLCRRPPLGGIATNVRHFGVGALNIDGCRIGTVEDLGGVRPTPMMSGGLNRLAPSEFKQPPGRWPANVTLSHAEGCRRVGTRRVSASGDAGPDGKEPVDSYDCVPGCPVAMLDAQAGVRTSGTRKAGTPRAGFWGTMHDLGPEVPGSIGSASRFFYCPKTSRSEREAGCEGIPPRTGAEAVHREEGAPGLDSPRTGAGRTRAQVHNDFPTVKPLGLMRWLCKLVGCQPGSLILDPFTGSGTTIIAAALEGFRAFGIEREVRSAAIARARVSWWVEYGEAAAQDDSPDDAVLDSPP